MKKYNFTEIEKKWQKVWEEQQTFRCANPGEPGFSADQAKYYVLDMFPYPSGKGLHVGHPLGYIATDVTSRYKRMQGFSVLHPMGFDAFGLPAEQYAVETGTHPRVTTEKNIANMLRQLKACGLSYDWGRQVSTTDENYYRWTQWIFLQLFNSYYDEQIEKARPITELVKQWEKEQSWHQLSPREKEQKLSEHRLAYMAEVPVNWCPDLGTVLANEEVTVDGRSERGNYPVYRRPLKQWMLRITAYADRLVDDLALVDWPDAVKEMQRNWIGRSEGARVCFDLEKHAEKIEVFTTRPDTLFGCTFVVLAPEHPLVTKITTGEQQQAVEAYVARVEKKQDVERLADAGAKEGVFTGCYATNPLTQEMIPVWIADYVLMGYGTGAIMAVPGHDQRDFDFAKKYSLDVRLVVEPSQAWLKEQDFSKCADYAQDIKAHAQVFVGDGLGCHSSNEELNLNGLATAQAKQNTITYLEQKKLGQGKVQYKLRDWLFSRQRYWGEPFPILHGEDGEVRGVDEQDLPVRLPELNDFKPQGQQDPQAEPQPSLHRAEESWKTVKSEGKTYRRELNTMPQWAGSCWYYLRFLDPKNSKAFVDGKVEKHWMSPGGVDLYVGGVEHAVLHLLYARFWHKVLFDLGHVSTKEPFGKLFNQGYIQAYSYQDERGIYVDAFKVKEVRPSEFEYEGKPVSRHLGKMGKSLKNSISPDEVIEHYGCDTFRLYEMYLGPVEQSKIWDTEAIVGVHRFLQRLWRNLVDEESGQLRLSEQAPSKELRAKLHKVIKSVTEYMDQMRFNTAIAQVIQLNNDLVSLKQVPREVAHNMVLLLAPIAPHICEELWNMMGHSESLAYQDWPKYDLACLLEDAVEVVVQVNGKKRGSVHLAPQASQVEAEAAAKQDVNVAKHLEGQTVKKVIYVPGRLLNWVV